MEDRNATIDALILKYIPTLEKDCRLIRAKKDALRIDMKRELLIFISKHFTPKTNEPGRS
ncbi:hypothetical protein DCC81_24730 [Chitinophaga parva]|uniref:Uncharacterized protein n=1 Tax=Chitinophaga parva TaxID=2169414 RepID=A0A2T7BBN0_9BACT|nr:hypothetical protein [Chitinophaga parva]PUZ21796.1 hypothetical protein DCC81_24730 [Chitinophaga parva]